MTLIDQLPTPCLIIDQARLESNLSTMQARATDVKLRPHTKTHKMIALARRQQEAGAKGITVAKVSEAAVFVEAGFKNVRIAYTVVGRQKLDQLAQLSRQAHMSFCADTAEGARAASERLAVQGATVDVLLEIDAGYGRCGIPWDSPDLIGLARTMAALPGLNLCGILTHEGNAYTPGLGNIRRVMEETRDRMLEVARKLHEAGVCTPGEFEISIGSTPSVHVFENRTAQGFSITEVRPGNYVFNDMTQVAIGVCGLQQCALTVLSTVTSKHRTSAGTIKFFLDAGRKVLTSDVAPGRSGYGCLLYNAKARVGHPHARLTNLSEEHGWGQVRGGTTFAVGDRVQVVPNHACVVVNTQNEAFVVDNDRIVDVWTVDARGCVS